MTLRSVFSLSALNSDRLAWMDYAKGMAISLVVLRHLSIGMDLSGIYADPKAIEFLEGAGLTFRMPLFFLLSGIFFRKSILKHSQTGYIVHKLKTIIYPYLIWSFLFTSLQIAMSGYINSNVSWWSYLDIFVNPWGHWWFLVALFNVSILYLVVNLLAKGKQLVLLAFGLVLYFTANYFTDFSIAFHFMRLFIFFVVGDMIAQPILDKNNHSILASRWLMVLFMILALAGEWLLHMGIGLSEIGNVKWRNGTVLLLLFSLIGSCAFIWLSYRMAMLNSKYLSWIRLFGQHSLYIYLLHPIIGSCLRLVFVKGLAVEDFWIILAVSEIACLIVPIFFYRLCKYNGLEFLFTPQPLLKSGVLKYVKN